MSLKCIRFSLSILCNGQKTSRFIECYQYAGPKMSPTILYVPGFYSTGHGIKSEKMMNFCQDKKISYICYDPEGVGQSKINDYTKLQLKNWFEDAETVITSAQSNKIILVGNSLGGCISIKMAMKYPELIKGLVLLAPAMVDNLKSTYDFWLEKSSVETQKQQSNSKISLTMDTNYGSFPIHKEFLNKSAEMMEIELISQNNLEIQCPIVIIHSLQDDIVPYEQSLELMQKVSSDHQVELVFVKYGDHRLSDTKSLEVIIRVLENVVSKVHSGPEN